MAKTITTKMKTFIGSYNYNGVRWVFDILAKDHTDAEERLKAMTWGKIDGELMMRIPASAGWLAWATCWLRNTWRRNAET